MDSRPPSQRFGTSASCFRFWFGAGLYLVALYLADGWRREALIVLEGASWRRRSSS